MQILDQLGSGEGMPVEAIRAATADRASAAPLLVDAIERCEPNSEVEENGLFIAFHLLGQWREKSAYRPLARFLRRPDVKSILGDATTETSHKIMAGVFDGDPGPIYDIINDFEADEFVRGRMFDALVILVFRGELDRAEVADFLQSRFTGLQPQDRSAVWDGWQGAVALLALAELKPLVQKAFQHGFIDETLLRFKEFEDDLREACADRPLPSWQRREYEPFGDVVDELSRWAGFQPKQHREQTAGDWRPNPWPAMPIHNPFRNVGRNDPCPCGSGKKFKKCCLGKPVEQLQAVVTPGDPFSVDEPDDFDDADGPIQDYDPLVEPDAHDWLATGEQRRLDVVERYHRREDFNAEIVGAHAAIHVIIENQIAEGNQLPVRATILRLMDEGLDRHEAIHAIAAVLASHINEQLHELREETQQKSGHDINAAYFSALKRLTAKSWLRSG
jgi:hypothetical protein